MPKTGFVICLIAILLPSLAVSQVGWEFTQIADDTQFGDVGPCTICGTTAVDESGNAAFVVQQANGSSSLALYENGVGVTTILDSDFSFERILDFRGGNLLFEQRDSVGERRLNIFQGGSTSPINSVGRNLGSASLSPDGTVSYGTSPFFGQFQSEIQEFENSTHTQVVSDDTGIPGKSQTFRYFHDVERGDGNTYFVGSDNNFRFGIYSSIDGNLTRIEDDITTGMPAVQFDDLAYDREKLFYKRDSEEIRVFDGQNVDILFNTETIIPDTDNTFVNFDNVSASNGILAFSGFDEFSTGSTIGIYSDFGGELATVIEEGDLLDGRTIDTLRFGDNSFNNGYLVFAVEFNDGSEAIYLARTVPEPSTAMFLASCLLLALKSRRRS